MKIMTEDTYLALAKCWLGAAQDEEQKARFRHGDAVVCAEHYRAAQAFRRDAAKYAARAHALRGGKVDVVA